MTGFKSGANTKNIAGKRYGRLVAVNQTRQADLAWRWLFQCDCGRAYECLPKVARNKQSCGCEPRPAGACDYVSADGLTCNALAKSGRTAGDKRLFCDMHLRFYQMRYCAKSRGLLVPELHELEAMVPADMRCPMCKGEMEWRSADGRRRHLATLQHWNDGTMGILCLPCNTAHAQRTPVLDERELPPEGTKACACCRQVRPAASFGKRAAARDGLSPYCRDCKNAKTRGEYWRAKAK